MRRHAAPMRLIYDYLHTSAMASREAIIFSQSPTATPCWRLLGRRWWQDVRDVSGHLRKRKAQAKCVNWWAMSSSMAVYNSNSSARTLTSTSMQGHHPTQYPNWLVPKQWPQETGQPTQQTYQATPAPWRPPNSLSGVLQVWLPPTKQGW